MDREFPGEAAGARRAPTKTAWVVWAIAGISVLAHLVTADRYGYFRDALYYIACARHLAFGYVDMPPMAPLVTWLTLHTLGSSLLALHVFPALANAGVIVLTAVIARELGGGRYAQGLAALSIGLAAVYVIIAHQIAMNVFEPLLWMGCAYLVVRILKTGNQRLWLWFGVLAGLGLENKYSIAIFGLGVVVGLLLTEHRRVLRERWIYLGGMIAFAIFLPNLIWNIRYGFPFIQLMHNIYATGKNVTLGPAAYWGEQVLMMSPVNFLVWFPGLVALFFAVGLKRFRVLGCTFVVAGLTLMILKGKDYYSAPAYPMLLAAGSVLIERVARRFAWLKLTVPLLVILGTAPFLPMMLPILPLKTYLRYQEWLRFSPPATEKSFSRSPLPQYYSDELGWPEMADDVAKVYNALPPAQRAETAIFGQNYGEAGAIDFFGPKRGLPPAISAHQNYYFWGPRQYTGKSMIVLGDRRARLEELFEHVTLAGHFGVPYALEQGPIWLCTGPRGWTLRQLWPSIKVWR